MHLLRKRGQVVPQPAPGFRFGMLGEVEVPLGIEMELLEGAIDQAAAHLFHGRYRDGRTVLEQTVEQYPFVAKLLDTIPAEEGTPPLDAGCR